MNNFLLCRSIKGARMQSLDCKTLLTPAGRVIFIILFGASLVLNAAFARRNLELRNEIRSLDAANLSCPNYIEKEIKQ